MCILWAHTGAIGCIVLRHRGECGVGGDLVHIKACKRKVYALHSGLTSSTLLASNLQSAFPLALRSVYLCGESAISGTGLLIWTIYHCDVMGGGSRH